MTASLLTGYASGVYSSRRIANFREPHLQALGELFVQLLKLCEAAGLVKLGHVALDGTKACPRAAGDQGVCLKYKAMSCERRLQHRAITTTSCDHGKICSHFEWGIRHPGAHKLR